MFLISLILLLSTFCCLPQTVAPWPPETRNREVIAIHPVKQWDFNGASKGWSVQQHGKIQPSTKSLRIRSTGPDLILNSERTLVDGAARIKLRMRSTAKGPLQVFWVGRDSPGPDELHSTKVNTPPDGSWQEYTIEGPADWPIRQVRLDPCNGEGEVELDWIRLEQRLDHPLLIRRISWEQDRLKVTVRNAGDNPLSLFLNGIPGKLNSQKEETWSFSPEIQSCAPVHVQLTSPGLPVLKATTFQLPSEIPSDWKRISNEKLELAYSVDGSSGAIIRDGKPAAWLCPLAWDRNNLVQWDQVLPGEPGHSLRMIGEGTSMEIRLVGNEVHVSRHSSKDIEGPVFRVPGNVEQAVLPGLEHLGRGERSSTDLDIHGPERIRHTPELTSLTWPFMSMLTDRASVSIQWDSSQKPQPVFAAPDFFEGTHSQRLALKGRKLEARVRIAGPWSKEERLETTLRWGVRSMGGLPETPKAPRTADAQLEFCASALESGILRGENGGWYHALVPGDRTSPERPVPFADHLSILHRLTGRIEDSPSIVPGGSHLDDPSIWFLRNRAEDWLRSIEGRANKARKRMRTDGSFGYGGAFRQGHFEDTASGHCARPVVDLLLAARWTGNQDFLSAGIKGLENLKRFRTPRGAQVWECPLHAPDILAAALLVQANVLGHELTGNPAYLEEARRWAWSGLPYVYLWDDGREIMRYATIATLCATKYQAPVWIGRPVQWCGIVYADAILDLDRHDPTMDWRKVALGILVSGEQQQYTNGPSRGLLADSTILSDQSLHPYDITPCAIAQLRLKIMERPQGIYSSEKGGHRLISPYPIRSFDGGNWELDAPEGLKFQVLLDGQPFEAR